MSNKIKIFWNEYKHSVLHGVIAKLEWKLQILKVKHNTKYHDCPRCREYKL